MVEILVIERTATLDPIGEVPARLGSLADDVLKLPGQGGGWDGRHVRRWLIVRMLGR